MWPGDRAIPEHNVTGRAGRCPPHDQHRAIQQEFLALLRAGRDHQVWPVEAVRRANQRPLAGGVLLLLGGHDRGEQQFRHKEADDIAAGQREGAVQPLPVDEGAVGAAQIADHEDAVAVGDHGVATGDMALCHADVVAAGAADAGGRPFQQHVAMQFAARLVVPGDLGQRLRFFLGHGLNRLPEIPCAVRIATRRATRPARPGSRRSRAGNG